MIRNILLFLCTILIAGCYHYPYYHDRNGNKFRPSHPKDISKWYFSSPKRSAPQSFDISHFGKDLQFEGSDQPIEYLTTDDVNTLKEKVPQLLLFIWNPYCSGENEIVKYANKFDSLGVPVIIASLNYDVDMVKSKLKNTRFAKRAIYIIPSVGYYPNNIVDKENAFLKILCKSCYKDYQDELALAQGLLFKKGIPTVLYDLKYDDIKKLL